MNLKLVFVSVILLLVFVCRGQENTHRCYAEQLIQDKSYFSKFKDFSTVEARSFEDLTVPVVVHIVYEEELQNVSDDLIYTMIDLLNADFTSKNLDISKVPQNFKSSIGNPRLEFCLASIDPSGESTNGIIRYQTVFLPGISEMSDGRFRLFHTSLGGADTWDTDLYLNIYITPLPNSILGFAIFPESRDIGKEDGVCIDYKEVKFGETTSSNRQKLGRTLTHEVGHWLGLRHIWGELEGSCIVDDEIDDTPPQAFPYYGCPEGEKTSCDHVNAHMNYMDYTNDQCMYYFSNGQVEVMRKVLTEFRPLIGQLNLCGPDAQHVGREFKLYPNPFNEIINIEIIETAGKEVEILVFEISGKLVLEKKVNSTGLIRLPTSQLGQGFYVIQVREGENIYTYKTLKIN